ncbi:MULTISPECIES: hypothetical protein [Caproicibacterium]|uniref:Uncharacterized protein n=1 Tax=Caproicibacterium argilliputei TaxID=3030016 RepID=A0AA97D940_9FIRM|nr:hypothetical protein [Caproicibacterium argilliputei]WOC32004.1 hypothetical protein PXC00_12530 [Caproicibacterium argilliputei]
MLECSDGKMSEIFFCISFACTLIAMVFSPLNQDNWSIAAAAVAIVTALGGLYLAFQAWNEPLPEDAPPAPESAPRANPADEKMNKPF